MNRRRRRATDHRGVVLEAIASSIKNVQTMISTLRHEGLVTRTSTGQHYLTQAGYAYLTQAAFDIALYTYAPRPGARKPRKKGGNRDR